MSFLEDVLLKLMVFLSGLDILAYVEQVTFVVASRSETLAKKWLSYKRLCRVKMDIWGKSILETDFRYIFQIYIFKR